MQAAAAHPWRWTYSWRRERLPGWSSGSWFLAVVRVIGISDTEFGPEDDPWVSLGAVALPLLAGFAIGRSWAVVLALSPLLLYAVDHDTGDLAPGFAITAGMVMLEGGYLTRSGGQEGIQSRCD